MKISSAKFIKGIVGNDELLNNGIPQVAFIGRSNVGKSSVINSLVNQKDLARTSSFPGHTQEINVFLINNSFYLVDLPGYGFAKASKQVQELLQNLIYWYLFDSEIIQTKVVLIVDAVVGLTDNDINMLESLEEHKKPFIVVANKIDKLKSSQIKKHISEIQSLVGKHKVIVYSAEKKLGVGELLNEMLK